MKCLSSASGHIPSLDSNMDSKYTKHGVMKDVTDCKRTAFNIITLTAIGVAYRREEILLGLLVNVCAPCFEIEQREPRKLYDKLVLIETES